MTDIPLPPEEYKQDLGGYEAVLFDSGCSEPIAWGFKIRNRLGEDRFNALRKHGELVCLDGLTTLHTTWALVTHWLTREEATTKYGTVTDEPRGPRGGFRSVTFGTKKFLSRRMA